RASGQALSRRYLDLALAVARTVCSLDREPSGAKLAAVDQFRARLEQAMDKADVGRAPAPRSTPPAGPEPAAAETPVEPARPLAEVMADLEGLIGLREVKAEVRRVADLIQVENLRKQRGLPVAEQSRHLVVTGNP